MTLPMWSEVERLLSSRDRCGTVEVLSVVIYQ
jgi:hypothetical protein